MHSGYNDIWPPPRFDKDFFNAQTIQSAGKNIIYSYHDTLAILAEVEVEVGWVLAVHQTTLKDTLLSTNLRVTKSVLHLAKCTQYTIFCTLFLESLVYVLHYMYLEYFEGHSKD